MNGPRILGLVALAAAVLLWMALSGPADADLERGLAETDAAFAAVDGQLAALDADYRTLCSQGLVLGLRETHDQITSRLAELRSRRLDITGDAALDRRQRLPRLRELAASSDEVLALAVSLRRECDALVSLRRAARPLVEQARAHRDALGDAPPPDDATRQRIDALAASLSDLEQRLQLAEQQIRRNLEQGVQLGQGALRDLRSLIDTQATVRAALPR